MDYRKKILANLNKKTSHPIVFGTSFEDTIRKHLGVESVDDGENFSIQLKPGWTSTGLGVGETTLIYEDQAEARKWWPEEKPYREGTSAPVRRKRKAVEPTHSPRNVSAGDRIPVNFKHNSYLDSTGNVVKTATAIVKDVLHSRGSVLLSFDPPLFWAHDGTPVEGEFGLKIFV